MVVEQQQEQPTPTEWSEVCAELRSLQQENAALILRVHQLAKAENDAVLLYRAVFDMLAETLETDLVYGPEGIETARAKILRLWGDCYLG